MQRRQNEEIKARELILAVYEKRRDVGYVSPAWLATEVMHTLDPERKAHPIEYAMAHLQFRQLAREVCGQKWESDDEEISEQHELFPRLQRRYPIARKSSRDDPQYALLELLTDKDYAYNLMRLRREAHTKLEHADALEAYWISHRKSGAA